MNLLSPPPYSLALQRLRRGLVVTAALSAMVSVLMLTGSVYMLQVYGRVLGSSSVATLLALFAIVAVLYLFLAGFDGLRMRLLSRLSLQLDDALSATAFRADLAAARNGAGATLGQDLETLRRFLSGPSVLALFDLPFTFMFVAVLFLIHPVLGWMTLGGMLMAAGLAVLNRFALKSSTQQAQRAEFARNRLTDAARRGASGLGALGMEGAILRRWLGLHHTALRLQQKGNDPSETLAALSRAFRMLLQSALLTAAAWLVIQGAIPSGVIAAASILSGRALAPVDQLIGQWRSIEQARNAHHRLKQMQDQTSATIAFPALTGALEVKDLTYFGPARSDGATPTKILDSVSFSLAPGDGLGLVGASASGKSTLARAIVGAIRPDAGDIRFDGASLRHWEPDQLGRQIGYLPQRIDLLPGSLRDNIARFDPQATDAAVIAAAKAAGVHDMILQLPDGYGTDIGQSDVPLSGGQVQRVGLARALYGSPRILVLDEPNAHLDMAGEAALVRSLTELRKTGVTVIVMAHRAGALSATDRLMVLESGRIVQDGPRDAVLGQLGGAPRASTVPAKISIRNGAQSGPARAVTAADIAAKISAATDGSPKPRPLPFRRQRSEKVS